MQNENAELKCENGRLKYWLNDAMLRLIKSLGYRQDFHPISTYKNLIGSLNPSPVLSDENIKSIRHFLRWCLADLEGQTAFFDTVKNRKKTHAKEYDRLTAEREQAKQAVNDFDRVFKEEIARIKNTDEA